MASKTLTYNADTASFVRSMESARQSLLSTGDASDRAKAKILENSQQQIEAALQLGKSQETLDRITQQTASSMAAVTEKNSARIEAAMDRQLVKARATAAELEKLGRIKAPESHGGFTDRMATSALVHGVEGNPGIRSAENALTLIPGLTTAAQGLAPLIGGAGLAGLLFEMGEKGYEAFQKMERGAKDTQRAFDEIHGKSQSNIDDLELQNQKLQDQIDKVSGHPNNGMATALLEAKKAADSLLNSLMGDRKELEALFKEHSVGALQSFLTGVAGTGSQETNILKDQDDLQDKLGANSDRFDSETAGIKDPKLLKAARDRKRAADKRDFAERARLDKAELARLQKEQSDSEASAAAAASSGDGSVGTDGIDNSAKIRELKNTIRLRKNVAQAAELSDSITDKATTLGGLKQDKGLDEAKRKADEARLKALEGQAEQLELNGATPKLIYDFWQGSTAAFTKGSSEYNTVLEKQVAIAKAGAEKVARAIAQARAGNTVEGMDILTGHKEPKNDGSAEAQKGIDEFTRKLQEDMQKYQDLAATSEARIQSSVRNRALGDLQRYGQISPQDAAKQQANINAQSYETERAALQKQLADAKKSGNLGEASRAQEALEKASADRMVQIQEDAAKIVATTWGGALKNSWAEWVQQAQDAAQQIAQLTHQAVDGVNNDISGLVMGQHENGRTAAQTFRNNLSKTGEGVGKTLVNDGLKQAESSVLKGFGIGGKADGSKSNPFYVLMAGGVSGLGAVGPNAGILASLWPKGAPTLPGVSVAAGAASSGGFWSSLSQNLFGGGKALGGGVEPGVAYDVGEMGREKFVPSVPGTIIPNRSLNDSPAQYTINVQKGVTPAEFHQGVQAALSQYHQKVMPQGAVAAVHNSQQRRSGR